MKKEEDFKLHPEKYYLTCELCGTKFLPSSYKSWYFRKHKSKKFNRHIICSYDCMYKHKIKEYHFKCDNCGKEFIRHEKDKRTKHNFCSQKCSAIFYNSHKTTGFRRSKIELFLEKELNKIYKTEIKCNDRKLLNGLELDFYIPEYNIAIELNGIIHYKPIYGKEKYLKVKENDNKKKLLCENNNINLLAIDISKIKNFNNNDCYKVFNIINNYINNIISPDN